MAKNNMKLVENALEMFVYYNVEALNKALVEWEKKRAQIIGVDTKAFHDKGKLTTKERFYVLVNKVPRPLAFKKAD